MYLKRYILIALLVCLGGCTHTIKKKWNNFSAYYNTFYNAKKDFKAGLRQEQQQPVTLDPATPFRMYPAPVAAGSDHFKQAIESGNEILRRHARSKWADNALLLIGKSHYYLGEYFPAIQKFETLLDYPMQSKLQQRAVIWKGRALVEIQAYRRGVQFLQQALADFGERWSDNNKAEVRALLAQHLSMLNENKQAIQLLRLAIPNLHNRPLKGRAYLLLGQMLQKQQQYHQAVTAYSHVKPNHPHYVYIYQADLRKAMVLQSTDKVQRAVNIYLEMLNDDKNYNNRREIDFYLAQAYQKSGKFNQAETLYKNIVRLQESENIKPHIISKSYYQLGQMYSQHYHNYAVAAAYYDSSSTKALQNEENGPQTVKLAAAYKKYNTLHKRIIRTDSLLRLGDLNPGQLNAKLVRIRINRKQELEKSQNAVQQQNNKLTNVSSRKVYNTSSANTASAQFGFLDYHNRQKVSLNRQKFIAIWGNRPLEDNWRRQGAITGDVSSTPDSLADIQNQPAGQTWSDKQLGLDITEIPRSSQSRNKLRQQRYDLEFRLGSLFFLTLDQPDSARYYYRRVLAGRATDHLKARALYSMYELNHLHHQADSAAAYKRRILQRYPGSMYAGKVSAKQANTFNENKIDSSESLRLNYQQLEAQSGAGQDSALAVQLRNLALAHRSSPLAPDIYFRAIRTLVQFAKAEDSTHAAAERSPDLTANESNQIQPYRGPTWNQIRKWLADFKRKFSQAAAQNHADAWMQFLRHPQSRPPDLSCSDLNVRPQIKQGKKHFVQSIKLPQKVRKMHLSGSLRYRLIIGRSGKVESFKLLSAPTHLGIEPAYEKAMKDHLQFKPITQNGHPVRVSCEMSFPIKQ